MSMIRDKLLKAGVKNLREFGYPACDTKNILTDRIFSAFFVSMLNDNKGHGAAIDAEINNLLSEMQQSSTASGGQKP